MNTKTRRQAAGDRYLYVCHHLTQWQVIDLAKLSGLSVMDLQHAPTDSDLRRAIRILVEEAWGARQRRARQREARAKRVKEHRKTPK